MSYKYGYDIKRTEENVFQPEGGQRMKPLTFRNQMLLDLVILAIGFVCSTVTKIGLFTNAAWALYGLLFVIHPVWPERARGPRMALYMRLTGVVIILLGLITRFGV